MFQSYDHPQGAHIVPCQSCSLKAFSNLYRYVELVLWQHVCKQIYVLIMTVKAIQQYSDDP